MSRRAVLLSAAALVFSTVILRAGSADLRLIQAIRDNDATALRASIAAHADVNGRQADGGTALHWAAYLDDASAATQLITAGANVNAVNDLGVSPLWLAASNGSTGMIERLLAAHADANIAPSTGATPLMISARIGNLDAVTRLLVARADVNAQEAAHRQTALMWAAAASRATVSRVLIEAGADIHARSMVRQQRVILCCAEFAGDAAGQELVGQGGFTPLLFAVRAGALDTVDVLMAAGANVNDAAPAGTSALTLAAHVGHTAVAMALLDHGAAPNASGAGYTALHAAVIRGDLALVERLLHDGADPNARLTKGSPWRRNAGEAAASRVAFDRAWVGATPFLLAALFGNSAIMRALGSAGADPQAPLALDGMTPVIAAIQGLDGRGITVEQQERIRLEAVKTVVSFGGNVAARNNAGDTALHIAAKRRFRTVVQFLVDAGMNVNVTNTSGQTPLTLAMTDYCRYLGVPGLVPCREVPKGSFVAGTSTVTTGDRSTADLLRDLGARE